MNASLFMERTASALLFLGACFATSGAEAQRPSVYRCADGRTFSVEQGKHGVHVTYYGRHFRLSRRPSEIGARYASSDATLIIDSDMAVFVTEHIVDLQACRALSA